MVGADDIVSNDGVANVSVQADHHPIPSGPALRAVPTLPPGIPPAPQPVVPPIGERVRWLRFAYRLPSEARVARVQIWRELRRLDAVRVGPATWAIRAGAEGEDPLAAAHQIVARGQGHSSGEEARDDDPVARGDDALRAACEHQWDAMFNDADRLHVRLEEQWRGRDDLDPAPPDGLADEVEQLRRAFHDRSVRAVLPTDSGRRIQRRIAEIEALTSVPAATELTPKAPGVRYQVANPPARWALGDGTLLVVAAVDPWPTLGWETAFSTFEAMTYVPSAARPPLAQGAFSFSCRPEHQHEALVALNRRLTVVTAMLP